MGKMGKNSERHPFGEVVGWGEDTSKVLIRLFALAKHPPGTFLYRYATPLYRSHTFVWDLYTIG